ncbi:hypothetical protein [Pseudodesulfovibrio tunisiensis]|uniref:hypothetical protein n=1 Tax=Pseudodesulfovibrio tunisiensis TaxID=463192 RepID=UPI001FB3AE57|nr:hypothetical protein [Pseudodesulfovibrio tunisiensis]
MKRILMLAVCTVLTMGLLGCGTHITDLDRGAKLRKQGDCAGAMEYFDATIANTKVALDLAYAEYLKAQCLEESGDHVGAYRSFFTAREVICWQIVHNDARSSNNAIARSEYCQVIIPERLKALEPSVGKEKAAAIRKEVDDALYRKYMDTFFRK